HDTERREPPTRHETGSGGARPPLPRSGPRPASPVRPRPPVDNRPHRGHAGAATTAPSPGPTERNQSGTGAAARPFIEGRLSPMPVAQDGPAARRGAPAPTDKGRFRMLQTGLNRSRFGLEQHALRNLIAERWNDPTPVLYEEALRRNEGVMAEG